MEKIKKALVYLRKNSNDVWENHIYKDNLTETQYEYYKDIIQQPGEYFYITDYYYEFYSSVRNVAILHEDSVNKGFKQKGLLDAIDIAFDKFYQYIESNKNRIKNSFSSDVLKVFEDLLSEAYDNNDYYLIAYLIRTQKVHKNNPITNIHASIGNKIEILASKKLLIDNISSGQYKIDRLNQYSEEHFDVIAILTELNNIIFHIHKDLMNECFDKSKIALYIKMYEERDSNYSDLVLRIFHIESKDKMTAEDIFFRFDHFYALTKNFQLDI